MNVNGTRFHLLYGEADWTGCYVPARGQSVAELNQTAAPSSFDWMGDYLQLRAQPPIFHQSEGNARPDSTVHLRRGMVRDWRGTWYWIDRSQTRIVQRRSDRRQVEILYPAPRVQTRTPGARPGHFAPQEISLILGLRRTSGQRLPSLVRRQRLAGLALTTSGFLVAGVTPPNAGLLRLDLWRESEWEFLPFPDDSFIPAELAATPDGGLLILDRENAEFWRLYSDFQLPQEATRQETTPAFVPADGSPPTTNNTAAYRYSLDDLSPLAIEAGPDDSVLILTTEENSWNVYRYQNTHDPDQWYRVRYSLQNAVRQQIDEIDISLDIQGRDIAFLNWTSACYERGELPWLDFNPRASTTGVPLLFVAHQSGKQVIAFEMQPTVEPDNDNRTIEGTLKILSDYLPMRNWGGRGLVATGCRVYYDSSEGRSDQLSFVPLARFGEARYEAHGVLVTPYDFLHELDIQPFDGETTGCVWHRVMVDAYIPPGTRIRVRARAADAPDLLVQERWRSQPALALRPQGSELPFYTVPTLPQSGDGLRSPKANAGTWELLLQEVQGRYVQLELTVEGNGRATPRLYALRLWYPRFSYLQYLPAIYREDPFHASFLERWLANFEGVFTELEDMIDQLALLFDPRTAPADALDWLAGWIGLLLDPVWSTEQRRLFIRHAMTFYRLRGTILGMHVALSLYLDESFRDEIFFESALLANQRSRVRIIEPAYYVGVESQTLIHDPDDNVAVRRREQCAVAHTFRVLVPYDMSHEQVAMIHRIVELVKPAHTDFSLVPYNEGFLVEMVYLGVDSILTGDYPQQAMILDEGRLDYALLQEAEDQQDVGRFVIGTNRLPDQTDEPPE